MLVDAAYRGLFIFAPNGLAPSARPIQNVLQWADAATRALVWYGFLFALIAAELFAGRVLRDVVRRSLGRPSLRELEGMLRGPLGDPGLRVGFWRPSTRDWVGHDGAVLEPPKPGQRLSEVERDGRPAAAIIHDDQLSEDPELLQAAGAVALLSLENAELDAAWRQSLDELSASRDELSASRDELSASRARLVEASNRERRKLERDLHDGAQQRLMGVQIKLRVAQERAADEELAGQLEAIGVEAAEAVEELRTLAHGIYPATLRSGGLVSALRSVAMRSTIPIVVRDEGIGRCSAAVEGAIYFCAVEAVQNAIKHAGSGVRVAINLGRDGSEVHFAITDGGVGMDAAAHRDGDGLIGMRDRVGAVGGELQIVSAPGKGTTVRGAIPDPGVETEAERSEGAS